MKVDQKLHHVHQEDLNQNNHYLFDTSQDFYMVALFHFFTFS
ncbi:hypothetical protein PMI05_04370 [Brevibacillus sp. BC25]|nr:hypothetical protein PMI05_04370 [Brevibacillus sp. BC25]